MTGKISLIGIRKIIDNILSASPLIQALSGIAGIMALLIIVWQWRSEKTTTYIDFRKEVEDFAFSSLDWSDDRDAFLNLNSIIGRGLILRSEGRISSEDWETLTKSICDPLESTVCNSFETPQYPRILLQSYPNILEFCFPRTRREDFLEC